MPVGANHNIVRNEPTAQPPSARSAQYEPTAPAPCDIPLKTAGTNPCLWCIHLRHIQRNEPNSHHTATRSARNEPIPLAYQQPINSAGTKPTACTALCGNEANDLSHRTRGTNPMVTTSSPLRRWNEAMATLSALPFSRNEAMLMLATLPLSMNEANDRHYLSTPERTHAWHNRLNHCLHGTNPTTHCIAPKAGTKP